MKIAILNDTHAGIRNDNSMFLDYQDAFYTKQFFPYLKANGINTIIHLGDMFDRRKYLNHNTLKRFREMFVEPVIQNDITVYVTVGNHDVYWKNTNSVSSPKMILGEIPNFKIIDMKPEIIELDGVPIGFVPWISEDITHECIEFIQTAHTKTKYLFGHFEIRDLEMMKGVVSTDGIESGLFDEYDLVGSGHYHTKSTSGPIHYFGTQMEFTWSDYGDPKYFHVFDTENETLESVRNYDLMFYRLTYDDTSDNDELVGLNLKNKYVKLVVKKKTDTDKYNLFVERVKSMQPADFGIIDISAIMDAKSEMDETDVNMTDGTQTTLDILNQYVDGMEKLSDDTRDSLKSLLNELYVESSHMD